jgi:hypothetical protein
MADMQRITEEVFQQIQAAGAHALKDGMGILLPQYLDAEEIESLEMTLYLRSRTRYAITHHLGERRIWVRQKPCGQVL